MKVQDAEKTPRRTDREDGPPSRQEIIWSVVSQIPPGHAVSYGEVARRAGLDGMARYVGYALGQLAPGSCVPWHRVVNRQGRISFAPGSPAADRQKALLLDEGAILRGYRVSRNCFDG